MSFVTAAEPSTVPQCICRYDGQIFVKPQEVLARDRLLGTYEVSFHFVWDWWMSTKRVFHLCTR